MLFSSAAFILAFLPLTLLIYFIVPPRFTWLRNLVLLIASLIFYGWGEPKYILVMLASIIANYILALLISKDAGAKFFLFLDVVVNLGILGFFKYTDFVIETINSVSDMGLGKLGIALPIGISFYTFQTMSYVIDVYRGKVGVQKNILTLAAYITLFPQLIAGPIVRYSDVEIEMRRRDSDHEMVASGIRRFVIGLGKKVLIANQVAVIWDQIYGILESGGEISVAAAWLGALAFTFQIYFDFSGYSDMAIGLGRIFGFNYLENFNYPYISDSITEFWRRWHISLSSWFKEYVYIPLGGNRKGIVRQIINIGIVWALTGLWHGASWNFVLWGVYYGILLTIEKLFLLGGLKKLPKAVRIIYTFVIVMIGWVIFNITDFTYLGQYLGIMFGKTAGGIVDSTFTYYFSTRLVWIIVAIIGSTPLVAMIADEFNYKVTVKKADALAIVVENVLLIAIFSVSIAFIVSGSYNPFLYFRF